MLIDNFNEHYISIKTLNFTKWKIKVNINNIGDIIVIQYYAQFPCKIYSCWNIKKYSNNDSQENWNFKLASSLWCKRRVSRMRKNFNDSLNYYILVFFYLVFTVIIFYILFSNFCSTEIESNALNISILRTLTADRIKLNSC